MNRREFVAAGVAATAVAAGAAGAKERKDLMEGEVYELRLYHLRRGPNGRVVDDYWRDAAIPALRRAGAGPVGAFNVSVGPDSPTLYILIPHRSMAAYGEAPARLADDKEYQSMAAAYLNRPATDPPFIRMESSLLAAFSGMPRLEPPAGAAAKAPRMFELRTYESHNERAAKKKIEMFNTGEIAIFRRAGLNPVFFGETLIGSRMPNLTYMLAFDDMAVHDRGWGQFGADPEWKKLSSTPGYTDAEIVTTISNLFLRPAPYSQI